MKIALDSTISGVAFSPDVIYARPNGTPTRVAFSKDGQPWYERGIAGTTGQFSLPTRKAFPNPPNHSTTLTERAHITPPEPPAPPAPPPEASAVEDAHWAPPPPPAP